MVLINDNSSVLQIGDPLPKFSLPSTSGLLVESLLIKDPVLVVVFTCNHCPYAKAYYQRLVDMARHFDNEGVQFVCINSNDAKKYPEDSFENMKDVQAEYDFPFPYCYDESQRVAKEFGALCTPHCFVFNQDRMLCFKGRIDDNWQEPDSVKDKTLHNAIESVLANEVIKQPEVNAIGCSIKWK